MRVHAQHSEGKQSHSDIDRLQHSGIRIRSVCGWGDRATVAQDDRGDGHPKGKDKHSREDGRQRDLESMERMTRISATHHSSRLFSR